MSEEDEMAPACEFYAWADNEGGIVELVIDHGVDEDELPEEVRSKIEPMKDALEDFEDAVKAWHEQTCPDPDCFWR